tara:strand:- start:17201 stop:18181 length:981 start_codon:yes stop_codon:yes gene_type:complete
MDCYRIIVTGGAGYIGSHFCKRASSYGHKISVIDNLITGKKEFVRWGKLYFGDVRNEDFLREKFLEIKPDFIVHFAASAYVSESLLKPLEYISNNIDGMRSVCKVSSEFKIPIVFSSSCSVYGEVKKVPICELTELNPLSPYGETKLFCEKMLKWCEDVYGLRWVSLRYFNASGADSELEIGENHDPETHIIPLAIKALGKNGKVLKIYGSDFGTPDGTAVRDFIHVLDLAEAHLKAINYLSNGGSSDVFNLGSGRATSIKSIIGLLEKISSYKMKVEFCNRREGDPSCLYADISKAKKVLKWEPKLSDLRNILLTAWNWHQKINC